MPLIDYSYNYQKPETTYTLDQFIACQSDTSFCYNNLSFIDQIDNIKFSTYNVVSDYMDEIVSKYCVDVELSDDQLTKYKYRPKLLCYDIYGSQELYYLILVINDMRSIKEFSKNKIKLPTKTNMTELTKAIINSNRLDIQKYNEANIKKSTDE
jgi:hypothetical protein